MPSTILRISTLLQTKICYAAFKYAPHLPYIIYAFEYKYKYTTGIRTNNPLD